MNFYQTLVERLPQARSRIRMNEPMAGYTTFRIGGPADCLFLPSSADEILQALRLAAAHDVQVTLLGRGSNIIVADRGIRALTIMLGDDFARITHTDHLIEAEAGASLAAVAALAARQALSGIEFASGIPGTLGGGVMMNAGAYDGCLENVVVWTEYLDETLNVQKAVGDEHQFGYRQSVFSGSRRIILRCCLQLKPAQSESILDKMADLAARRRYTQPLDKPSAGSAFKRPQGYYAGKLITECDLKGYRFGGAMVSEKHAGFIVNLGHATAGDVLQVFCHVQKTVLEKTGVLLEPEVRFVGDWQGETQALQACHFIGNERGPERWK